MVYEAHVGYRKINTTKSSESIKKSAPRLGARFFAAVRITKPTLYKTKAILTWGIPSSRNSSEQR